VLKVGEDFRKAADVEATNRCKYTTRLNNPTQAPINISFLRLKIIPACFLKVVRRVSKNEIN